MGCTNLPYDQPCTLLCAQRGAYAISFRSEVVFAISPRRVPEFSSSLPPSVRTAFLAHIRLEEQALQRPIYLANDPDWADLLVFVFWPTGTKRYALSLIHI